MNHTDHVALIRSAIPGPGTWADLGSGTGAFTLALADLLGPLGCIHSVDRDQAALGEQTRRMQDRFPEVELASHARDFEGDLDLPPLDGLMMANSLHFIRRKAPLLRRLAGRLKPGGRFVLVEYNTDRGNSWVPHPLSFDSWERLAAETGLIGTVKIGAYPSRFLGEIYAAVSATPNRPGTDRSGGPIDLRDPDAG